jgi:hypothetical protein
VSKLINTVFESKLIINHEEIKILVKTNLNGLNTFVHHSYYNYNLLLCKETILMNHYVEINLAREPKEVQNPGLKV